MRIKSLYYLSFDADTAVPLSVAALKRKAFALQPDLILPKDVWYIYAYLTKNKICPGRFQAGYIRLILEMDSGDEFLVDGDGCVRKGRAEYFLRPGAFLHLFKRLETIQQSQRRGG